MDLGPIIERQLKQQRASGFSGIAGTSIAVHVPLSQQVINEAAQAGQAERPEKRFQLQNISVLENRVFHVTAQVEILFFTKTVSLEFQIDPASVDFQRAPLLGVTLLSAQGIPMPLIEIALNVFVPVPESIRINGKRIEINLRAILERQEMGWVVPLVKILTFKTERGRLYVDALLKVDAEPELPKDAT